MDLLGGDIMLRSKRELIEKFIEENLPLISDVDAIEDEFEKYWQDEKVLALSKLCEDENLDKAQFKALIDAYILVAKNLLEMRFINVWTIDQVLYKRALLASASLQR